MSKISIQNLNQILIEALELAAEDRAAFLLDISEGDSAIANTLAGLLDIASQDDTFLRTGAGLDALSEQSDLVIKPSVEIGDSIDAYQIVRSIGSGGFGEVFEAQQVAPVKRRVALKILKPGMDTKAVLARFEAERQALALMDHPSIAKVFDAGETPRGLPYFVMELVDGEPLTDYCDRYKLTIRSRLKLFAPVCRAVQHAHQKGIIHRDLKPPNILVTLTDGKPEPKIIDFGIAKATVGNLTDQTIMTEFGQVVGTPAYMSPEQADLTGIDVDTRSDIYSLGVVLYRLLTGALPFDLKTAREKGYQEVVRVLREVDAAKPSDHLRSLGEEAEKRAIKRGTDARSLKKTLRRELDWIVLKALEKDRTRRYETAVEFARDIERYLIDKPVLAGPPGVSYRAQKFIQRNKLPIAAALLVAMVLVGGLIQSNLQRLEVQRAKSDLEAVTAFQASMLIDVNPHAMGTRIVEDLKTGITQSSRDQGMTKDEIQQRLADLDQSLRGVNLTDVALSLVDQDILARALQTLDVSFADQPLIDAELRTKIGLIYVELGMFEQPQPLLEQALATRQKLLGERHADTLASLSHLGFLFQAQGKVAQAEAHFLQALKARRQTLGRYHPDTLVTVNNLASLLWGQGRYQEAEPYYREALVGREQVLGKNDPATLQSIDGLSVLLNTLNRFEEAEPLAREALRRKRQVLGDQHPDTLVSVNNLAFLLQSHGRLEEAEIFLREAVDGQRRVLGEDHPDTLIALNNMGVLHYAQGRFDEVEPYFREVLQRRQEVLGHEHPDTLISMGNLGDLLTIMKSYAEAEALLSAASRTAIQQLPPNHIITGVTLRKYGRCLAAIKRFDEAEENLISAWSILKGLLGDEHLQTQKVVSNLVDLYEDQDRGLDAAEWRSKLTQP